MVYFFYFAIIAVFFLAGVQVGIEYAERSRPVGKVIRIDDFKLRSIAGLKRGDDNGPNHA